LAFATAVPAVEAAPIMSNAPLTIEKSSDVTNVRCWRCRGWRGRHWGRRGWRGRYWGPRVWVAPVIVVGPRRWGWCGPRWNRYRCRIRY
jgi:hypothetical protein